MWQVWRGAPGSCQTPSPDGAALGLGLPSRVPPAAHRPDLGKRLGAHDVCPRKLQMNGFFSCPDAGCPLLRAPLLHVCSRSRAALGHPPGAPVPTDVGVAPAKGRVAVSVIAPALRRRVAGEVGCQPGDPPARALPQRHSNQPHRPPPSVPPPTDERRASLPATVFGGSPGAPDEASVARPGASRCPRAADRDARRWRPRAPRDLFGVRCRLVPHGPFAPGRGAET